LKFGELGSEKPLKPLRQHGFVTSQGKSVAPCLSNSQGGPE